jgi:serine/threonine protein kinase
MVPPANVERWSAAMTIGRRQDVTRELTTGSKLDQYRLLDLVSRGGMASIFKAQDTESGSVLAIKVPHFECEKDVVYYERFRREEELGSRLSHPALVKVLKPREKSRPYIAMEFVEGDSLRAIMDRERPMASERALPIARQLCEAVAYLHERGVVHRDLKPENIIVTGNGDLRIIDLGIAQDRSARRITWGPETTTFGTPDYMAPERIVGRRGDARVDIYSVGAILYEMLTGHVPHENPNPYILMYGRTNEEPLPLRYHQPEIDPAVEAIVLRALERPVFKRHASSRELLAELADPAAVTHDRARDADERPPSRWPFLMVAAIVFAGLGVLVTVSHSNVVSASAASITALGRTTP